MSGNLERRYRRVLRLLPGWYRERWEQDMVAAFLDSWLTGDPEADEYITRAAGPSWAEAASVARLAVRLHLGGAGTARRFAWGQAIRCAVLSMTLVQAVRGLDVLVQTAWSRDLLSWLPAPPASLVVAPFSSGIVPPVVWYLVACAWIAAFVSLVLGRYRMARVIATPAIVPYLIWVLQGQFAGRFPATPIGPWTFWILLNLAPVLAMTAFHGTPRRRSPTLAAGAARQLPAGRGAAAGAPGDRQLRLGAGLLRPVLHPGRSRLPGPRALGLVSPVAGSGAWSLTLALLAADAGAYRIFSIADYPQDPHLIAVSLAELVILVAAVALVVPDAVRAQAGAPALPPSPQPG